MVTVDITFAPTSADNTNVAVLPSPLLGAAEVGFEVCSPANTAAFTISNFEPFVVPSGADPVDSPSPSSPSNIFRRLTLTLEPMQMVEVGAIGLLKSHSGIGVPRNRRMARS